MGEHSQWMLRAAGPLDRAARWRRGNALGSDGATAIAGGLRHVPSLTHLCLRCEAARAER